MRLTEREVPSFFVQESIDRQCRFLMGAKPGALIERKSRFACYQVSAKKYVFLAGLFLLLYNIYK